MTTNELLISVCLTMALLCGVLAVLFFLRSRLSVPEYAKMPTVCDLIDYATMPTQDVIVLKSGGLMSMMELMIPDMSNFTDTKLKSCYELCQKALLKLEGNYAVQIDAIRSKDNSYAPSMLTSNVVLKDKLKSCYELCQKALLKLEGNYAVQIDAIRSKDNSYAPSMLTSNVVLKDLESRREQKFAKEGSYVTHIYLTITYAGKSKETRLISRLMTKEAMSNDKYNATLAIIKEFRLRVKIVADSLSQCFPVKILGNEEIVLSSKLRPVCGKTASNNTASSQDPESQDAKHQSAKQQAADSTLVLQPTYGSAITLDAAQEHGDLSFENATKVTAATSIDDEQSIDLDDNATSSMPRSNLHNSNANCSADHKADLANGSIASAAAHADSDAIHADSAYADATHADSADTNVNAAHDDIADVDADEADEYVAKADGSSKAAAAKDAATSVGAGDEVGLSGLANAQIAKEKFDSSHRGKAVISRLLTVIHTCLTAKTHPIAYPGSRAYLDSVLATDDYISGFTPKMGYEHMSVLSIEGLPSATHEAMLNTLATLPFAYRFNSRFVIFDHATSKVYLMKYRSRWSQTQKGILSQVFNIERAKVNQNAVDQVKDIDEAQRALDSNEVMFGSYTATLLIHEQNFHKLQEKVAAAIAAIERTGLSVRVETMNADDAFFGSLPGHLTENLRRPLVSQDVLLDLVPMSLPSQGEETSPNPLYGLHASPLMQVRTEGLSKYYLNLHDKDVANTLVIGPTGAGKSMLLGELIINLLRYQRMRVFAFDKGCSFHALTKALGGSHIILNNSERMLCPLYHLESNADLDYAQSFVELLLRQSGATCSPVLRHEIQMAIRALSSMPHNLRRLSDLHSLLCSRTLKEALSAYTAEQSENCILDGNTNATTSSFLTTFECADVFSRPESFSVPVLKQVFRLIEQQLDGNPLAIVVDEAWLMLKDDVFAAELLNWFKTLRKYNAFVILATQSLTDLEASEHFENILECAKTRIFLPNCDAISDALRNSYSMMGLSNQEINLVASSVPKKDYYFVKGDQRILFNLMLSAEEKALLSIAGEHSMAKTNALYDKYGPLFYTHIATQEQEAVEENAIIKTISANHKPSFIENTLGHSNQHHANASSNRQEEGTTAQADEGTYCSNSVVNDLLTTASDGKNYPKSAEHHANASSNRQEEGTTAQADEGTYCSNSVVNDLLTTASDGKNYPKSADSSKQEAFYEQKRSVNQDGSRRSAYAGKNFKKRAADHQKGEFSASTSLAKSSAQDPANKTKAGIKQGFGSNLILKAKDKLGATFEQYANHS